MRTPAITLVLFVSLLAACSGPGKVITQGGVNSASTRATETALYAQLTEWRGTPYLLGGHTKRGIDCSSFVQTTFRQRFSTELPRTTELQVREGRRISKNQLRTGDLVFFRIGRGVRHVGIYLNNGQFIHASKSAGVTESDLNSSYWAPRFWQARRLSAVLR